MQAEDTQFSMNMERRKDTLKNYLIYIHQLTEKEKRGKDGEHCSVEFMTIYLFIHFFIKFNLKKRERKRGGCVWGNSFSHHLCL